MYRTRSVPRKEPDPSDRLLFLYYTLTICFIVRVPCGEEIIRNPCHRHRTHDQDIQHTTTTTTTVLKHDNDDDGEDGAGAKLAHLLAMRDDDGVIVVVSRWYGGIHLGPKRFAHIVNVARELLVSRVPTLFEEETLLLIKITTER